MLRKAWLLSAAAAFTSHGLAQTGDEHHRCTSGELMRRVQIVYETDAAVPCEVHYFKDTEAPGGPDVLWRAVNESGYCEARTREFVERLESLGWQCAAALPPESAGAARVPGSEDASPPPQRDDTTVLQPGEPPTN